jgi:hypothetical protein
MGIRDEIHQATFLLRLLDREDESALIFRNEMKICPNDTVKRHTRLDSSPLKFKMTGTDNEGPQNVILSSRFFISSMSKCFPQDPVFDVCLCSSHNNKICGVKL